MEKELQQSLKVAARGFRSILIKIEKLFSIARKLGVLI